MEVATALEFTGELSPWAEVEWQAQRWQVALRSPEPGSVGLGERETPLLHLGPYILPSEHRSH